ncbi:MAG: carbohydrate ABC transporter permease, partial [Vallitaleaceae bacterium]|nr:carbohydrate ABC transporter permease [Vallitaleaceae bacterium]
IMLPLSKPVLAVQIFFTFAGTWNAYLWPLIILSNQKKFTLQLALGTMNTRFGNFEHYLMAGSLISIVPIVFLYILIQRYLDEGLTIGGIKG